LIPMESSFRRTELGSANPLCVTAVCHGLRLMSPGSCSNEFFYEAELNSVTVRGEWVMRSNPRGLSRAVLEPRFQNEKDTSSSAFR
jgi:hypothetical protein